MPHIWITEYNGVVTKLSLYWETVWDQCSVVVGGSNVTLTPVQSSISLSHQQQLQLNLMF